MGKDKRLPMPEGMAPNLDEPWDNGTQAYTTTQVREMLQSELRARKVKGVTLNGENVEPDADGNVNLRVNIPEIDATVNPRSTNPVQNAAIAQALEGLNTGRAASIRLNVMGEEGSRTYSLTLLDQEGGELVTTESWSGGGGGITKRIVLTRETDNPTVKLGDTVKLRYHYDQEETSGSTPVSTGMPADVTVNIGGGVTLHSTVAAGSDNEINVSRYLVAGDNRVTVRVSVGEGSERMTSSIQWNIQVVDLRLTSSYSIASVIRRGDEVTIPWTLRGGFGATVKVYVDGVANNSYQATALSSSYDGSIALQTSGMAHGTHTVQIVAEYPVNATTTIMSNSICYALAIRETGGTAPIVSARFDYPDGAIIGPGAQPYISARQYEYYTLNYAVYDPQSAYASVSVYEGDRPLAQVSVGTETQSLRGRAMSAGNLQGRIVCRGTTYSYGVRVEASDITLEEPKPAYRTLYLSALGRSNSDAGRGEWVSGDISAQINDEVMYGSDGWTGESLRLTGRGKVSIPYSPWKAPTQNATGATAFIVKYSTSDVQDDESEVIKCVDVLGHGLVITPTEIRMTTEDAQLSMKTAPNETYEVAVVTFPAAGEDADQYERMNSKMVYLYINGIMSAAAQANASVYQNGSPSIEIGSEGATTDVYMVRGYGHYLNDSQVLDCHILDQTDIDELMDKWAENAILSSQGDVRVDSVPDGMRVVVVTGSDTTGTATLLAAAVENDKKKKFNVDSILTYIKGAEDRSYNMKVTGGCISLQGTSSLSYPIKNYRLYTSDKDGAAGQVYVGCDKDGENGVKDTSALFAFKAGAAKVGCWCLKADFAESSSSHNTGMARLVQDTMSAAGELTPPQRKVDREQYDYDVRTTIDGEPCLLFYRATVNDTPVLLGKYNWNNDKSTEAVFGFCDIPGYHDNTAWFPSGNTTECWEFLTNDQPMGEFRENDMETVTGVKSVTVDEGYEGPYGKPITTHTVREGVAYDSENNRIGVVTDGEVVVDEGYSGPYGKADTECTAVKEGNKYIAYDRDNNRIGVVKVEYKWEKVFEARFPDKNTNITLLKAVVDWIYSTRNNPSKFRQELGNYFDVSHLCDYYEFTDIFGCVDQRVKNMMMAFWYNPDATDVAPMGKMRAYMIFYDNDTIMGVRNDGKLKYHWDIDENTMDTEMSTPQRTVYAYAGHDSVLWKNLRSQFATELKEAYVRLRARMSNNDIFNMFDREQSAKFPARVYNLDALSKYISPLTLGVEVKEDGSVTHKTYSHLESMQGSRQSHRHWWVTNRLSLLDAWAGTGSFTSLDLSFKGSTAAGAQIKATPARDYYFQFLSENNIVNHQKVYANTEWSYRSAAAPNMGTVFHFKGGEFVKALDLSGWGGFTDLNMPTLPRVEELTLGLVSSGRLYPLPNIAIARKMPLLRRLVMQGYTAMSSLDLSGLGKLEYLDLSGSAMATVTIERNAPLSTYITPQGMTTLSLQYLPDISNSGLTVSNMQGLRGIEITGCPQFDARRLVSDWLSEKATADAACTLRLSGIAWEGVQYSELERLLTIGTLDLEGTIALVAAPTGAQARALIDKFGADCFGGSGRLTITAPNCDIMLTAPEYVFEGATEANATEVQVILVNPDIDASTLNIQATTANGVNTEVVGRTVKIWSTETGATRSITINVSARTTSNANKTAAATIQVRALIYPVNFSLDTSAPLNVGSSAYITLVRPLPDPALTTDGWTVDWAISGDVVTAGGVEIAPGSADKNGCTITAQPTSSFGKVTITATVKKCNGSVLMTATGSLWCLSSDVIMTSETNLEVMEICYQQGWAANADYMTKAEAAAVTSIGADSALYSQSQISHFDEFYWFGLTTLSSKFMIMPNLVSIQLPQTLTSMEESFRSCPLLTELTIPAGVNVIDKDCFYNCPALMTLYYPRVSPPSTYEGLRNLPTGVTCHIPANADLNAWQSALNGRGWTFVADM